MATMTIRNIDEQLKAKLRVNAAMHGRSMEEEARDILRSVLTQQAAGSVSLVQSIRARVASFGGVDLEIPAREPAREPVSFDE